LLGHLKVAATRWRGLFEDMLLEDGPEELSRKIQAVEEAIYERLRAMAHDSSDESERQMMADAVAALRILKREKISIPDGVEPEQVE
jgi:hypothetical protein